MRSFQGKTGLLVIACLTVFVIAGSLLFKKSVVTPKTATAKATVSGESTPVAEGERGETENKRSNARFVALVVDPYSRPMPGDESVRQSIPNGLSLSGVQSGPTRTVPSAGQNPISLGPLRIQPPSLEGTLPDASQAGNGEGSSSAPSGSQTSPAEPLALPILVSVRGIVGTQADRAFIAVGGGSPRAARAGTDLGDGITVVRVSERGVVVRRGSQTKTIPVGKEIEL